ncbi:hypothetical protein ACTJNA_00915 [Klebsiella pneumoniae]
MTDLNKGKQTTNKTNSERFPQPPFPHQNNLSARRKMQPRPDHGEQSYQGSGRY